MDYDHTEIPAGYDRARSYSPELLALWMTTISAQVPHQPVRRILDLGCGTGRYSEALATHFDAEVIGIDPSRKMLEQARRKQTDARVRYQLGSAETIPLTDASVDLIFMSMIFHHLNDPLKAAGECRRVLRPGGTALLRAGTVENMSGYPFVDFFPASVPLMAERLPTVAHVHEIFAAAGFEIQSRTVITQQIAPDFAVYAEKLAAGGDSIIASLSPSDLETGLSAMRAYSIKTNKAVFEPIDFFVFR